MYLQNFMSHIKIMKFCQNHLVPIGQAGQVSPRILHKFLADCSVYIQYSTSVKVGHLLSAVVPNGGLEASLSQDTV